MARLVWLKDELTIAANDEPENDKGWYGNNKPAAKTGIQIYHYNNDQLGTPNELTNSQGEVVWLADYEAWGETSEQMCWGHILVSQGESCARVGGEVVWREEKLDQIQVSQEHLQPIRFQGQHFDEETGLHYNRFRYYDPDVGMFISRDPIQLKGGTNVFQYAPNPTGWVDPLGLEKVILFKDIPSNKLHIKASKIDELPSNVCGVYAHGYQGGITSTNNKKDTIPMEQIASEVNKICPKEKEIVLYSCLGGLGFNGKNSAAQQLANATGRNVLGYSGNVRYSAYSVIEGVEPTLLNWPPIIIKKVFEPEK